MFEPPISLLGMQFIHGLRLAGLVHFWLLLSLGLALSLYWAYNGHQPLAPSATNQQPLLVSTVAVDPSSTYTGACSLLTSSSGHVVRPRHILALLVGKSRLTTFLDLCPALLAANVLVSRI